MPVNGGFQPPEAGYSTNDRAARVCGPRVPDGQTVVPFDQPCEVGLKCPVCVYELIGPDGNYDDRLDWSEYAMFVWCSVCDRDYPSVICTADVDQQITMFLDCLETVQAAASADHCALHTNGNAEEVIWKFHPDRPVWAAHQMGAWDDAHPWIDAHITPDVAGAWFARGFTVQGYQAWTGVQVTEPEEARAWADRRFTPAEARRWLNHGYRNAMVAAAARETGLRPR